METFHQLSSKLYQPYRIAGIVCNHIPLCTRDIRKIDDTWISTAVDNVFLSFSARRLHLMCISNPLDSKITSLAADFHYVYAGTANGNVCAYQRGRIPKHECKVQLQQQQTGSSLSSAAASHILPCSNQILVIYSNNSVRLWNIEISSPPEQHPKNDDVECAVPEWELELPASEFEITSVLHPSGYVNKVLFGSRQGSMQLWNMHAGKMVYEFSGKHLPKFLKQPDDADNDVENRNCQPSITALAQSPVIDCIAIGYSNGAVVVHNLRFDQKLLEFRATTKTTMQDALAMQLGQKSSSSDRHRNDAVTSLAFRKDAAVNPDPSPAGESAQQQQQLLIVGTSVGALIFYDLNKSQITAEVSHAHSGPVTGMQTFNDEPIFATSSPDNALKLWIIDGIEPGARVLKQRDGHCGQARYVRFYDDDGSADAGGGNDEAGGGIILSSGDDSTLRVTSTVTDILNASLGRASYSRKVAKRRGAQAASSLQMPPIAQFDFSVQRNDTWDNVIARHVGVARASKWSMHERRMSQDLLSHPQNHRRTRHRLNNLTTKDAVVDKVSATSVCVSACGNFCFIGYNTGFVDKFNMQSNIYRGSCCYYPPSNLKPSAENQKSAAAGTISVDYTPKAAVDFDTFVPKHQRFRRRAPVAGVDDATPAHAGAVTGICTDLLNNFIITAGAGGDNNKNDDQSSLRIWNFNDPMTLLHTTRFSARPTLLNLKRDNAMLCVAFDNLTIIIFDILTRRVVRRLFNFHTGPINDVAFSPNGELLMSASMDKTLCTWDLIQTGRASLTDVLHLPAPCLSVSMSPASQYIATTHLGSVGIWLWHNKRVYGLDNFFATADGKRKSILQKSEQHTDADEMQVDVGPVRSSSTLSTLDIDELTGNLCSLSMEPRYKWLNFHLIDRIREKNKPREPPKIPKAAPFFLPSSSTIEGQVDVVGKLTTQHPADVPPAAAASVVTSSGSNFQCALTAFADAGKEDDIFKQKAFDILRNMGASAASAEINMLRPIMGGSKRRMCRFLQILNMQLKRRANVELCAAYLSSFLLNHDVAPPASNDEKDDDNVRRELQKCNDALEEAWHATSKAIDESIAVVNYLTSIAL